MSLKKIENLLDDLISTNGLQHQVMQKIINLKRAIKSFVKDQKAIARLINIDGLTGLYNHQYFHKVLSREISRSSRFRNPLSVILIDVDHFKKLNDSYGHQQGDAVLKKLSAIFLEEVRSYDIVARYGGEEFVLIMPDTARWDAYQIIERLRIKISGHDFPVVKKNKKINAKITISSGIAVYPENAQDSNTLIKKADQALYMAKEEGRNRTCASASKKGQIRFAYCPPALSPFFSEVLRGIYDVTEEVGNVEVVVFNSKSESDYKEQLSLLKKAVDDKKFDAIGICSKIDMDDLVIQANKSGTNVFVFNIQWLKMTRGGEIISYIGYQQEAAGRIVGNYLLRLLRYRGEVAVIEGIPDEIDSIYRKKGFIDALKNFPEIEVVASRPALWDRYRAETVAAEIIKEHPEIDAFFGLSDEMALGALDAVKKAGKFKDVFVIGLDGNENALRSIRDGELFATLNTNPFEMGKILIRTVIRSTIKEEAISKYIDSPIMIVDSENVDRYLR